MAAKEFRPHPAASQVATQLWEADRNSLVPGVDYDIDMQDYTRVYQRQDRARDPLFNWVKEDVFRRPTYAAFIALLDNYERETGRSETVTREEEEENNRFLDLILTTEPMKIAHQVLSKHGKSPKDTLGFKRQLHQIWFELYSRTRPKHGSGRGNRKPLLDSSGFEHVFVGESRDKEVIGFHNWIQFYLQEKKGLVDYQGYIRSRGSQDPNDDSRLITIQFEWKEQVKPVGSSFIGTSPEFEMALYTVCFLMNQTTSDTAIQIGNDKRLTVTTHRWNYKGKNYIGSSFPKAM